MSKGYYVYTLASARNGTLYTGVTSDLVKRVYEHKTKVVKGFSSRYNVNMLVHFEIYPDVRDALEREKEIKHFKRSWKLELIEKQNPQWKDLYLEIST